MSLNIVRRLIPDWGTTYGPPGDGPFPAVMILHGSEGAWSVEMTRRLEARLHAHGRMPEVHYYEGEDHIPRSEAENVPHAHLIDFLARHLLG